MAAHTIVALLVGMFGGSMVTVVVIAALVAGRDSDQHADAEQHARERLAREAAERSKARREWTV
jgi:hypothetical protein